MSDPQPVHGKENLIAGLSMAWVIVLWVVAIGLGTCVMFVAGLRDIWEQAAVYAEITLVSILTDYRRWMRTDSARRRRDAGRDSGGSTV